MTLTSEYEALKRFPHQGRWIEPKDSLKLSLRDAVFLKQLGYIQVKAAKHIKSANNEEAHDKSANRRK